MASRFWAGSSSEEESDHSDKSDIEASQARPTSRWAVESDSESEDEVRVVKSAKDKATENIEKSGNLIRNYMKINDWSQIQTEFDAMIKHVDKAKSTISQHSYKKFFIKIMVQLEDFLNETIKDKAGQKKMGKENNKSFIRMKGKIKNKVEEFRVLIDDFRANPNDSESEDSESEDSESEESESEESESEESESDESESDDESKKEIESEEGTDEDASGDEAPQKIKTGSESSDEWPSESESSSSSEEENNELKGRAKWLKTANVQTKKKAVRGPKVPKAQRVRKSSVGPTERKVVEEELKLTPSQFDRKMKEVVALRGRKATELSDLLMQLQKLAHYSRTLGPAREIVARMQLVGTHVYDAASKIDNVLDTNVWKAVHSDLSIILGILESNPGFTLTSLSTEEQADIVRAGRGELKEEDVKSLLPKKGEKGKIPVSGKVHLFVDRLQDEYVKSLQQLDPHTGEYISRLRDEHLLLTLAEKAQSYYERVNDNVSAASLALLRIEFQYYKHNTIASSIHAAEVQREVFGDPDMLHPACAGATKKLPVANFEKIHPGAVSGELKCDIKPMDFDVNVRDLCMFVYKHGDDRAKTRAMLCHIYHHAIHGRFYEARDLLLMSHLQETITGTDIPTQVLFNRMMVQMGLCAFRFGLIVEAHCCLSEICGSSRVKELLAQGVQYNKYSEKGSAEEKAEKRRQVPYHMHINLELLECCHVTSAMLLEIPNMASPSLNNRKRIISKHFRRYFDYYERQLFNGPPENTRDHVIVAAKLLSRGSWSQASDLILGLPVWDLLPGEETAKNVKEMLRVEIQVQALTAYLLGYSSQYESISINQLCEMFNLSEKKVYSVVSRMMINEKLLAAWDQRTKSIIMHNVDQSKLQDLTLQLAEKVSSLVENNERIIDTRTSGFNPKDESNPRQGRQNLGGDNRHRTRRSGNTTYRDDGKSSHQGRKTGPQKNRRGNRDGKRW